MHHFLDEIQRHDIKALAASLRDFNSDHLRQAISVSKPGLREFLSLLSPAASENLENLARKSRSLTLARFGRTIQLYTPLYLSSYCLNQCLYCGFRRGNPSERKVQSPDAVVDEAKYLFERGLRSLLLVAGDDPDHVSLSYLKEVVSRVHEFLPSVALEIAPQSVEDYEELRKAGAEGVIIYQETYDPVLYERLHPEGEKSDYPLRLETPERVARAGFHRVGVGALLGLGHPAEEAIALFLHVSYLLKYHWKTRVTISLPRMRPAQGSIRPLNPVGDRTLTQILCALRIAFPDVGIVLSTREEAGLRNNLIRLGVTHMSAGSRTEPGGYLAPDGEKEQFRVEDGRSPSEVAEMLASQGYEPVWKDWEGALV